jgi:hypothetical protein
LRELAEEAPVLQRAPRSVAAQGRAALLQGQAQGALLPRLRPPPPPRPRSDGGAARGECGGGILTRPGACF